LDLTNDEAVADAEIGGFEPDLTAWDAWRPDEITRRLASVEAPWCVVGGWALDLHLGGQRRPHDDLEIATPRDRFDEIAAALAGYELFVVGAGRAWPLAHAAEQLAAHHQTWVRDPATGRWRLDVFREPSTGDAWVCRRDPRIRLPYDRYIARTGDGIPYAAPEVVLLFKAKAARPKDETDFAAVAPSLNDERRRWLREALTLIHPGHRWLAELR
jgi:aminoglycoside-2''-adenylyltransferase